MTRISTVLSIAVLLLVVCSPAPAGVSKTDAKHPSVYRFVGGLWFDGTSFRPRTVYSVDGVFRSEHAGEPDATVDLKGRYVVPPFADAHNHAFAEGMPFEEQEASYLGAGIFYVKNPNHTKRLTAPIRARVSAPHTVDVSYSNGGLTASGGHPVQLYEFLVREGHMRGITREELDGEAFFVVDDAAELARDWPAILAGKPDFLKVYLEHSEEHERRKADPQFVGKRGLDPRLVPAIVARAHVAGLRVSAHVTTAADFRNALAAGVDEITHLPLERLTDEDAARAARQRTVVVTTTTSHKPGAADPRMDDVHRHNIALLVRAGVTLAIGVDNHFTAVREVENLARLGVLSNLELLKIWCESTPATIFPGRRIGSLADGYEASFVALDADPLAKIANVARVGVRFKQGHLLDVRAPAASRPAHP